MDDIKAVKCLDNWVGEGLVGVDGRGNEVGRSQCGKSEYLNK